MKQKIYISLFALTVFLLSCSSTDKSISTEEKASTESSFETHIKYSSSIIINSNDIIIYPLNLNTEKFESYSRGGKTNYWNLVFHNVVSGKSELLTNKKLIISKFNIGSSDQNSNQSSILSNSYIYYEVINSDFDGDKKLTSKDPHKLFISSLEGKSFTQISPENYAVYTWKIDTKHDLIFMDLIKDTNGDKVFDDKDEVDYFVYNLKTRAPAKPVFDTAFKKEVKALAKKVL
ncbi:MULTISPECIES: hypothetical protein [Pedobacter]|uniref:hypothetical protein n=1 Tax=Pedobacter TaxID=84567 RepID=UPI00120499A6|nr:MULTISPECIES: hypothetical protein [Pedobacter]RZL24818.1 MAG: hypothetical protein EOO96_23255 [Pedobacter sp.]